MSYKIFLTGKPAVGKTSTVAKLLGQGDLVLDVYDCLIVIIPSAIKDVQVTETILCSCDLVHVVISKMLDLYTVDLGSRQAGIIVLCS